MTRDHQPPIATMPSLPCTWEGAIGAGAGGLHHGAPAPRKMKVSIWGANNGLKWISTILCIESLLYRVLVVFQKEIFCIFRNTAVGRKTSSAGVHPHLLTFCKEAEVPTPDLGEQFSLPAKAAGRSQKQGHFWNPCSDPIQCTTQGLMEWAPPLHHSLAPWSCECPKKWSILCKLLLLRGSLSCIWGWSPTLVTKLWQ